jgi:hypothetical protein
MRCAWLREMVSATWSGRERVRQRSSFVETWLNDGACPCASFQTHYKRCNESRNIRGASRVGISLDSKGPVPES